MKNLFIQTVGLFLLFTIIPDHSISAQSSWIRDSTFGISYVDPSTSEYFRGKAQIVVNHEEQYLKFKDFKNALKKNRKITLKPIEQFPPNAFKPGSNLAYVEFKRGGKAIKLQNVVVEKNQQKGKKSEIKLTYESVL